MDLDSSLNCSSSIRNGNAQRFHNYQVTDAEKTYQTQYIKRMVD